MMIETLQILRNTAAAAGSFLAMLAMASYPAAAAPHNAWQAPIAWQAARPEVQQAGFNLHGLDGLPVYAVSPGLVLFTGYKEGLGQIVDIGQGNGVSTRYAHLDRLLVHPGQTVALHQKIGLVGDTGWALWPHLLSEASLSATR